MFFFIYAWTNVPANNQDPSDLRRHCTYYDITLLTLDHQQSFTVELDNNNLNGLWLLMIWNRFRMMRWCFDGLVQERRNSNALATKLRFSCTNPMICQSGWWNIVRYLSLSSVDDDHHYCFWAIVSCQCSRSIRKGSVCIRKFKVSKLYIAPRTQVITFLVDLQWLFNSKAPRLINRFYEKMGL